MGAAGEHLVRAAQVIEGWLGIHPLWISALALVICAAWRISVVLSTDEREAKRRAELLHGLRRFIDRALGSNRQRLVDLEEERALAQAEAYVFGQPIEALLGVPGIGARTVERLRAHGLRSIADVNSGQLSRVHQVGRVKIDAVFVWITDQVNAAVAEFRRGHSGRLPRDPAVDAEYDAAQAVLAERQEELGTDLEEMLVFDAELEHFTAAARRRGGRERLRDWLTSVGTSLRHPGGLLARLFSSIATVLLISSLPMLAMAWDPHLAGHAVTASLITAWFVGHFWVLAYAVLADRPTLLAWRPPDAGVYAEQRLQFRAVQMAHEAGVAPPLVCIPRDPGAMYSVNATVEGRPQGPSLVAIHPPLAHWCSPQALDAILGHEIGHLAGDHVRERTAWRMLLSPVRWLTTGSLLALGWAWLRVTHRVYRRGGDVIWWPQLRLASIVWFVLTLPLALAAALMLSILGIGMVAGYAVSRQNEYDADRMGARLSGSSNHMARALAELELISSRVDAAIAQNQERRPGAALVSRARQERPVPVTMRLLSFMVGLESTHPRSAARVEALESRAPLLQDILSTGARIAATACVAGLVLWYSVATARAANDWAREVYVETAGSPLVIEPTNEEIVPEPLTGTGEAEASTLSVVKGCWIRSEPRLRADKVGMTGREGLTPCVERGPMSGSYYAVRCGPVDAWLHRKCVQSGGD